MRSWRKWAVVVMMAIVCMLGILFIPQSAVQVSAEENVSTGTLGDHNGVTWTYDESTQTLTVTGEDSGMEKYPLSNISLGIKYIIFRDCKFIGKVDYLLGNLRYLTNVQFVNFDTSEITSMKGMFYGCEKITSLDLSSFNTSNVTDMSSMFSNCWRLGYLDLRKFDTSNVTDMSNMFSMCFMVLCQDLVQVKMRDFS